MGDFDSIENLAGLAAAYQPALTEWKAANRLRDEMEWYPHDTLGEFYTMAEFLEGDDRRIGALMRQGPVLDLCCGDGDLAYFLASQEYVVDAVDWPRTNYNHMAGVRRMRELTGLPVGVHEIDLNETFELPRAHYSVIFMMGALYHLRNPLTVLEKLARRCSYCVVTTRVTRFDASRRVDISELPVAYLADRLETNNDATNYYFFTPAGLRRALTRSGLVVRAMTMRGAEKSDPVTAEGDERAYCFARSAHLRMETVAGVYEEEGEWRWTSGRFTLRVWHAPEGEWFEVPVYVPDEMVARSGRVTVTALCGGRVAQVNEFREGGIHALRVPAAALRGVPAEVEFVVDPVTPGDAADERERGIVLPSGEVG